jgi:hypothetical protein
MRVNLTIDEIFQNINDENNLPFEEFELKLNDLVDAGFIIKDHLNDEAFYYAKPGLTWSGFYGFEDPLKKMILLDLTPNPKVSFILLNTQKGKLRQITKQMKLWINSNKKPVLFLVVDNDKALQDQSCEGVEKVIGELGVEMFNLSSNSKTTLKELKTYIDAYAYDDDYLIPVICLLANYTQCDKMTELLAHITKKIKNNNSPLRFGIAWDEADSTYKKLRTRSKIIDNVSVNPLYFITGDDRGSIAQCFVTATDSDLIEEYEECCHSYLIKVHLSEEDEKNYRAFHTTPDSVVHITKMKVNHGNLYAAKVIEENIYHFTEQVKLKGGDYDYRKIIINGNVTVRSMEDLAEYITINIGFNAMVFNGSIQTSIKVYREGGLIGSIKTRGRKFNEMVYYAYRKFNLHDAPLVIIGNRKVNRGLGYHFPNKESKIIKGEYGDLIVNENDGLIFTDMILGKIDDQTTATQKAGRLAGIIAAHCRYSGNIHFWTDKNTARLITEQNVKVDHVNSTNGYSAGQAVHRANERIAKERVLDPTVKQTDNPCDNLEELKRIMFTVHGRNVCTGACHQNSEGKWITTRYSQPTRERLNDSDYDAYPIVTKNEFDKRGHGSSLSPLNETNDHVVIPVYDGDVLKWYCRFKIA